jgi:uncharacterized membrane protein YfcA
LFGIILVGLLVGILIGLTGMGGGLLMTPLLILFYGFSPSMAIGTDLVYAAITKWVGGWQHFRQKTVELSLVKKMAIGSIPGSLLGAYSVHFFSTFMEIHVDQLLGHLLGFTFIGIAIMMIHNLFVHKKNKPGFREQIISKNTGRLSKFILLGLFGGFLVGLTSVGSGSIFIASLLIFYPLAPAILVGTDIFHGAVLTTAAGLAHLSIGTVDLEFVLPLLIGSIPGIILGSRLTIRIPEPLVRFLILSVLFFTGLKLI